jgi:preprotein translocase SecE subunit
VAKTRAQRKAEQRRRQAERARKGQSPAQEARAQHDTQVPESAGVAEAELAEHGVDLDQLRGSAPAPSRADVGRASEVQEAPAEPAEAPAEPAEAPAEAAPAPDKVSRRERRAEERERKQRAKESERRRAPREAPAERQRGGVLGFFASCWAELKRVQWPDRETLIQASAITLIFIAIMAAYLGILDGIFNWLVQRIL